MEMVCIVCPNGCKLTVHQSGSEISVEGARCPRGENFARSELTNPTRVVTTTVRTTVKGYPVLSVKTDGEIPKQKIFQLIDDLAKVTVRTPLPLGTVVLKNAVGTGVNVVTTSPMENTDE